MAELVHSIREVGAAAAGRRTPHRRRTTYELVMGERRWRASQAGRPRRRSRRSSARPTTTTCSATRCWRTCTAPSSTRSRRRRPTRQLLEDFGCTHEELAQRIGRSRPQISNTLRLLKLSPAVQRRVAAGVLSAGHARALLAVEDPELQDRLAAAGGRRGHQRARPRGDRRGRATADAPAPRAPRSKPRRPRARPSWPSGSPTASRPGSRSTSAGPRARSPSSSPSSTTCSRIVDIMDPRNRDDRPI